MRTASSAVRPASFRQRINLDRLRTSFPSGFERQAISLDVRPAPFPALPGTVPLFWVRDGQRLAAMR
ncbi:MAG TPA: hypothetical protein VF740_04150, partial [Candidatus Acidoferrum sp.]